MIKKLSQKERIFTALVYMIIVYLLSNIIQPYNSILPPLNNSWIWFWVAIVTLLVTIFVDQPFYVVPQNALLNSLGGFIAVYEVLGDTTDGSLSSQDANLWIIVAIVFATILLFSLTAIFLKDINQSFFAMLAQISTFSSRLFGSAYIVNTIIFLAAVWSFNSDEPNTIFWLLTLWGTIVALQPLEHIVLKFKKFYPNLVSIFTPNIKVGEIIARKEPHQAIIKITSSHLPRTKTPLLLAATRGRFQIGITIDNYELPNERWTRVLILNGLDNISKEKIIGVNHIERQATICNLENLTEDLQKLITEHEWYKKFEDFIGIVIEGSNVNSIIVELIKSDLQITEGKLLAVKIGSEQVLYQIIDGITKSEQLERANRYGFIEIKARKLGKWTEESKLEQVQWIPKIYSPVQFTHPSKAVFLSEFIGYMPQTSYGISVDCHSLVTHNTSILGVLGSGKTRLALELIGRMLASNIHVYIIDITGRYKKDLSSIIDSLKHDKLDSEIISGILASEKDVHENKIQGGNQSEFKDILTNQINNLLNNHEPELRIFEPNEFKVTEQVTNRRSVNEGGNWSQQAELAVMTPAKLTRIVTEIFLENVQNRGISEQARICLIFEEAHSLIPEWNVAVSDGDSRASNATARAILQGRKYGLGCILITQRTAHVTKSILNQCHTVFALQTFDKTGMDFLSNYIGDDYTNTLSSLAQRNCVVYGKALNTGSPLIIELNEHKESHKVASKFYPSKSIEEAED